MTIRTYVEQDKAHEHFERSGFISACRYGIGVLPEENEIGAIIAITGEPEHVWPGLWRTDCTYLERIFIIDQERAK